MIEIIKMHENNGYGKERGLFVRMSRTDAIHLIRSLSEQILFNSPNVGRWEPRDSRGMEFTIAVMPEYDKMESLDVEVNMD